MEDNNSWNELIFRHINARSEWLSSLIWRNRQKLKVDTSEDENDDAGAGKKVDLDPSDKSMIDWFDERQKNFRRKSEEEDQPPDEETKEPRGWSGDRKHPSKTVSISRNQSIVEEKQEADLPQCEAGDTTKARGWSGDKKHPSETVSISRNRSMVEGK